MFGIGLPEMIVILAVALIVVGPDKLPELARSLAKGVNELKKTMNQVKESLTEETKVIGSVQKDLQQTAGRMTENLLEDLGSPRTNIGDDTMEIESLEKRPWEEDAATEPTIEVRSPGEQERAEAATGSSSDNCPDTEDAADIGAEVSENGTVRHNTTPSSPAT